ncbi:4'-phosphopantetheinyl transferase family protein [Actinokineospora diospyrosa]|uniref:Phosphopantetheinyl transferase n=1 Tax=Actinokineospora diospyrosa TaxID=103728 RepID=A0ABT1IJK1_9PSEU|nr:4'-phosphopantetheinyl transferase family protein [Actinokineospora diospyrosa]MCP2272734.1 Phosphopantetheinyl transferase [Actinokineospora diospyrosa]
MTRVAVHVVSLRALERVRGRAEPDLPAAERAAIERRASGRRRVQAQAARVLAGVAGVESGNASHDQDFLVVAESPATCGVDVEDAAEDELREVATRFCAASEVAGPVSARALWTAKESAAKATRLGLRAGLRSIGFTADPSTGWSTVDWPYGAGFLTRTVDLGTRHCALTVRADAPPRVRARVWTPTVSDGRWSFTPAAPAGDSPAHRLAEGLRAFGGTRG